MHRGQARIPFLDGLRGIAIGLVVVTHFWGPGWAPVLPFGDRYAAITLIRLGWVGVELFFLISGLVIFLTLERCTGTLDFLRRRWLRLFPAMLIATVLTLAFDDSLQPIAEFQHPPLYDVLPGLTFINHSFYHAATHLDIRPLHHAFWTLYVEVGFYVVFALLYFALGWRRAIVLLCVIGGATLAWPPVVAALHLHGPVSRLAEPLEWIGCRYFWWFASGILFAKAREAESAGLFWLAACVGVMAAVTVNPSPLGPLAAEDRLAMLSVVALFAVAQRWPVLQRALSLRPLVMLGLVSYPLYLVHETIGLGLIGLTATATGARGWPVAVPAVVALIGVAWIMTWWAEPGVRSGLRRLRPSRRSTASLAAAP